MTALQQLRLWLGERFRSAGLAPAGESGGVRNLGLLLMVVAVAKRRDPIQPPPPIFDLLLAILFAWGGWKVWQKGRGWRSGGEVRTRKSSISSIKIPEERLKSNSRADKRQIASYIRLQFRFWMVESGIPVYNPTTKLS